jgi:hypothetical protein
MLQRAIEYNISGLNLKGSDNLGDPGIDENGILK